MRTEEITTRLDELADLMSAAVDSGKEPDDELVTDYAEMLNVFLTEHPSDCISWLREVYSA